MRPLRLLADDLVQLVSPWSRRAPMRRADRPRAENRGSARGGAGAARHARTRGRRGQRRCLRRRGSGWIGHTVVARTGWRRPSLASGGCGCCAATMPRRRWPGAPEELLRQAAAARQQEAALAADVEPQPPRSPDAVSPPWEEAERRRMPPSNAGARLARAEADRREGLAPDRTGRARADVADQRRRGRVGRLGRRSRRPGRERSRRTAIPGVGGSSRPTRKGRRGWMRHTNRRRPPPRPAVSPPSRQPRRDGRANATAWRWWPGSTRCA